MKGAVGRRCLVETDGGNIACNERGRTKHIGKLEAESGHEEKRNELIWYTVNIKMVHRNRRRRKAARRQEPRRKNRIFVERDRQNTTGPSGHCNDDSDSCGMHL